MQAPFFQPACNAFKKDAESACASFCSPFAISHLAPYTYTHTHTKLAYIHMCVWLRPLLREVLSLSLSRSALCGHNAAYFMATANCSKETALSLQLSRPWLAWIMKGREGHQQLQHAAGRQAASIWHIKLRHCLASIQYSPFTFITFVMFRFTFLFLFSFHSFFLLCMWHKDISISRIYIFCQLIGLTNLTEVEFIKKCDCFEWLSLSP